MQCPPIFFPSVSLSNSAAPFFQGMCSLGDGRSSTCDIVVQLCSPPPRGVDDRPVDPLNTDASHQRPQRRSAAPTPNQRNHVTPRDVSSLILWSLIPLERPECPEPPRWFKTEGQRYIRQVVVVHLAHVTFDALSATRGEVKEASSKHPTLTATGAGATEAGATGAGATEAVPCRGSDLRPALLEHLRAHPSAQLTRLWAMNATDSFDLEFFFRPASSTSSHGAAEAAGTRSFGGLKDAMAMAKRLLVDKPNLGENACVPEDDVNKPSGSHTSGPVDDPHSAVAHHKRSRADSPHRPHRYGGGRGGDSPRRRQGRVDHQAAGDGPAEATDDAEGCDDDDGGEALSKRDRFQCWRHHAAAPPLPTTMMPSKSATDVKTAIRRGGRPPSHDGGGRVHRLCFPLDDAALFERHGFSFPAEDWRRPQPPPPPAAAAAIIIDTPQHPQDPTTRTSGGGTVGGGFVNALALDCEMVLTDAGSALARLTVLRCPTAEVELDLYVRPDLPVTDYLTQFSGVQPHHLLVENGAVSLAEAQDAFLNLIFRGDLHDAVRKSHHHSTAMNASHPPMTTHLAIAAATPPLTVSCHPQATAVVVGHSLENDFKALKICPREWGISIIDTTRLYPHPRGLPCKNALRFLAHRFLNGRLIQTRTRTVQSYWPNAEPPPEKEGEEAAAVGHDPREDAKTAMDLVTMKLFHGPDYGLPAAPRTENFLAKLLPPTAKSPPEEKTESDGASMPRCSVSLVDRAEVLRRIGIGNSNTHAVVRDHQAAKQALAILKKRSAIVQKEMDDDEAIAAAAAAASLPRPTELTTGSAGQRGVERRSTGFTWIRLNDGRFLQEEMEDAAAVGTVNKGPPAADTAIIETPVAEAFKKAATHSSHGDEGDEGASGEALSTLERVDCLSARCNRFYNSAPEGTLLIFLACDCRPDGSRRFHHGFFLSVVKPIAPRAPPRPLPPSPSPPPHTGAPRRHAAAPTPLPREHATGEPSSGEVQPPPSGSEGSSSVAAAPQQQLPSTATEIAMAKSAAMAGAATAACKQQ